MSIKNPLYSTFGTDKKVETDGIVVNYGQVRFRIARAGGANQKFKKVFQHKMKPLRRQIENEQLTDDQSERLFAEVYAETVVLSWETNFGTEKDPNWKPVWVGEDGVELEFSKENVTEVLIDLPELFADLKTMASQASNYRRAEAEADAGN